MTATGHGAVRCVVDLKADLGEGAVWAAREAALYFVDINAARLYRLDCARPGGADTSHPGQGSARPLEPDDPRLTSWPLPSRIGCFALRPPGADGAAPGAVVALEDGFHSLDFGSGAVTYIAGPGRQAGIRFNDGKCSPDGRFFAGTMDVERLSRPIAQLYRLDPDLSWRAVVDDLIVSNGIGWSADGSTMYLSDSKAQVVWLYDYDTGSGEVSNRRELCRPTQEQGRPDGAAIDVEGNYWSAGISAGVLNKWSPAGELLTSIPLPCARPTCPAFGGPDLRTIYLTSLRHDLPAEVLTEYPLSGGVFAVDVDVPGVPIGTFGG
ncbi:MAG: SMP-30/gluconolactonase/LRE family protein [Actinomycetales bacterium]